MCLYSDRNDCFGIVHDTAFICWGDVFFFWSKSQALDHRRERYSSCAIVLCIHNRILQVWFSASVSIGRHEVLHVLQPCPRAFVLIRHPVVSNRNCGACNAIHTMVYTSDLQILPLVSFTGNKNAQACRQRQPTPMSG